MVFDEFHERNIYADVSLALALRTQKNLRPDLAIAVCSASMDSDAISAYLGGAEKFECGARLFPVETEYAPPKDRDSKIWDCAAREFDRLAREESDGSFLIFMPGVYEINKTVAKISASPRSKGFDVFALHGDLPPERQDRILADTGRRKVIVATNVAETSLTIEGVRFVIDSGLARVARFDPNRGVNTLLCERISLASATQRAGRAGRTAAGRVVKLWRKGDEEYFADSALAFGGGRLARLPRPLRKTADGVANPRGGDAQNTRRNRLARAHYKARPRHGVVPDRAALRKAFD